MVQIVKTLITNSCKHSSKFSMIVLVTQQIENHLSANMNIKKRDILIGNFLGGLAWGVGTVIGASVVVAIIGAVLNHLGLLDFMKNSTSSLQLYR